MVATDVTASLEGALCDPLHALSLCGLQRLRTSMEACEIHSHQPLSTCQMLSRHRPTCSWGQMRLQRRSAPPHGPWDHVPCMGTARRGCVSCAAIALGEAAAAAAAQCREHPAGRAARRSGAKLLLVVIRFAVIRSAAITCSGRTPGTRPRPWSRRTAAPAGAPALAAPP